MKLGFKAEALICNDEFLFYIITNNSKLELYKYKNHHSIKLADEEPRPYNVKQVDNVKAQPQLQFSPSTSNWKILVHSLSAPPRHQTISYNEVSTNVTNNPACSTEKPSPTKYYSNKYTKLISILCEINIELEEKKNRNQIESIQCNDGYAINLSPCTYLWDEAYEIIDNDDYDNLSHPVEEKVQEDIVRN